MAQTDADSQVPTILDPSFASMARELAQDIRSPDDILKDYGFTGAGDPKWLFLQKSADFRRLLAESAKEWNAADSTRRRVQLKSLVSLEMTLPNLHSLVNDSRTQPAVRIDGAKLLQSIAGLGGPSRINEGESGGGVSININFGGNSVSVQKAPIIEGKAEDADDE
jgi:hypothetical protein